MIDWGKHYQRAERREGTKLQQAWSCTLLWIGLAILICKTPFIWLSRKWTKDE